MSPGSHDNRMEKCGREEKKSNKEPLLPNLNSEATGAQSPLSLVGDCCCLTPCYLWLFLNGAKNTSVAGDRTLGQSHGVCSIKNIQHIKVTAKKTSTMVASSKGR